MLDTITLISGPDKGFVKISALFDFEWTYAILITFDATNSLAQRHANSSSQKTLAAPSIGMPNVTKVLIHRWSAFVGT
jgi:hypothetical protein